MTALQELGTELTDHLTPADRRLFDALDACFPEDTPAETEQVSLDKPTVLAALEQAEGKALKPENLRQRVSHINTAFKTAYADAGLGDPPKLRSTKAAFVFEFGAFRERLQTRAHRRALAEGALEDNTHRESELVPSRILRPYRVFVSHAWENAAAEQCLSEFLDDLSRKLRSLPEDCRAAFALDLWHDKKDMHDREAFTRQTDKACKHSHFALFILSPRFEPSEGCERERRYFEPWGNYLQIQLNDLPETIDAKYKTRPIQPKQFFKKQDRQFSTLLHLWSEGTAQEKERFVCHIRDQLCAHFKQFAGADAEPTGLLQFWRTHFEPDIPEGVAVDTKVSFGRTPTDREEDVAAAKQQDALPVFMDWAKNNTAEHRVVALLGGFGMGKTVTAQRFAEALTQDETAPTPVYFDLRRLIEYAEPNKTMADPLDRILHTALSQKAAVKIDPKQLLDLIKRHPCVVIFDGLDEVGNRIGRDHAAALYRRLLEIIEREVWEADEDLGRADWEKSRLRIFVTCRSHFFRSVQDQESTLTGHDRARVSRRRAIAIYHMAPLSLELIEELFIKYLGAVEGRRCFQMIRGIHDLPGLAQRPIMARYISETADELLARHERGQAINIAAIYQTLFERALGRDEEKLPNLTEADRIDVLKALAVDMHQQQVSTLKVDALEEWFTGFGLAHDGVKMTLASGVSRKLLLTELRNVSFLVRVQDDHFTFAHTSFYEYFLALALKDALSQDDALTPFSPRRPSEETLAFCLSAAEAEGEEAALAAQLQRWIVSNASAEDRGLVWALMTLSAGGVPAPPDVANLSGLDLRWLEIPEGAVWRGVNLRGAVLTGGAATEARFIGVDFEGAVLGDVQFDACAFEGCAGTPIGAESARFWRPKGDPASRPAAGPFVWPGESAAGELRLPHGHSHFINSVAFSQDGRFVLTGSEDQTARLWDARTGAMIREFKGHGSPVWSVAFSPQDGRFVLTGSDDKTARLWDARTGAMIREFKGHESFVQSVAFSPQDGRFVLTGSSDQTARLWDARTGAMIREFKGHGSPVWSVAFSPQDGRFVLTGSLDQTARLWDARTGAMIREFKGHGSPVWSVAFSPQDGRFVLTGSSDQTARLWDARTGAMIREFKGHGSPVWSVAFSPQDGRFVLTGSDDKTARLWDTHTGAMIRKFKGHGEHVRSVAFSPQDGRFVLTGSLDQTARLWDARTGAMIREFKGHEMSVLSVAFSPQDGRFVLTGSFDQTARLWDARTGAMIRKFKGHERAVLSVAFSPQDGRFVLTGSFDQTARLWDARTGAMIRKFKGHESLVLSVAFSPQDGRFVLTGSFDQTARLWDARTGAMIRKFKGHEMSVQSVAFSPQDGRFVLTGSSDQTARLWDARTGAMIREFKGHGEPVRSVAFSPQDGRFVLTGSSDQTARLWDTHTGAMIRKFKGHENWVQSVAFSPQDGRFVLTGSSDQTARLWDTHTGAMIRKFKGHENWVQSVAFSPQDGRFVLTGSYDNTARLWDAETGEALRVLRAFPNSWAVQSGDDALLRHGPGLWRYAHALIETEDGPQVVRPSEADLLAREVPDREIPS